MRVYLCLDKIGSKRKNNKKGPNIKDLYVKQKDQYWATGLKINEKFQSQSCDRIPKFRHNLATFSRRVSSRRIFARLFPLHFPVNGLANKI